MASPGWRLLGAATRGEGREINHRLHVSPDPGRVEVLLHACYVGTARKVDGRIPCRALTRSGTGAPVLFDPGRQTPVVDGEDRRVHSRPGLPLRTLCF